MATTAAASQYRRRHTPGSAKPLQPGDQLRDFSGRSGGRRFARTRSLVGELRGRLWLLRTDKVIHYKERSCRGIAGDWDGHVACPQLLKRVVWIYRDRCRGRA